MNVYVVDNNYPLVPIPSYGNKKIEDSVITLPHQFYELFKLIGDINNGEITMKIQNGIPTWASYVREHYNFKGGNLWIMKLSAPL
mgnify:CR=1 FL=1